MERFSDVDKVSGAGASVHPSVRRSQILPLGKTFPPLPDAWPNLMPCSVSYLPRPLCHEVTCTGLDHHLTAVLHIEHDHVGSSCTGLKHDSDGLCSAQPAGSCQGLRAPCLRRQGQCCTMMTIRHADPHGMRTRVGGGSTTSLSYRYSVSQRQQTLHMHCTFACPPC